MEPGISAPGSTDCALTWIPCRDAAPTVSLPKISGTAQEGKTLTASATAGQADNPVTYQWFSSASAVAIGSGSTYKVQEGDEGHTIEVVATVTNEQSLTVSAPSAATSSVIDAAPTVTTPIVTGTAHIGSTLTASATSGEPGEEGVSYQWMENNGSGGTYQNMPNATGQTYAPQEGDEGFRLEVVATVTNDDGTVVSKTSAPTGVVTETEPAPTFTITTSPLTLPKGGSVLLPISNVAGFDADDNVQVTIGGIASYESIVAASDGKTSSGSSFTFSAAEVNSGLTLNSFYTGTAKPVNTLSFVAKNTAAGETSASVAKTIKVTDPPPASSSATTPNIALLGSDMAGAFATSGGGQGGTLISEFRSSLMH
jgi:hypothetical protein